MTTTTPLEDRLAAAVESVDGVHDWQVAPERAEVEFVATDRPEKPLVSALSDSDIRGTVEHDGDAIVYRLDFGVPVRRSPASLSLDADVGEEGPWTLTVELTRVESAD